MLNTIYKFYLHTIYFKIEDMTYVSYNGVIRVFGLIPLLLREFLLLIIIEYYYA